MMISEAYLLYLRKESWPIKTNECSYLYLNYSMFKCMKDVMFHFSQQYKNNSALELPHQFS
jgi:hypothetical protein